jgi:AbrB family looped-hinge helix DNA binding protein
VHITSKGQVTIPAKIREEFGFVPETEVEFVVEGGNVILRKVESVRRRGRGIVERLRGTATTRMSTEEILALTRK